MNLSYWTLFLLLFSTPSLLLAGAEGLILHMPIETMEQRGLVHLELRNSKNQVQSGAELKKATVHLDNCTSEPLHLGYNYFYGYYPSPKKVGIILPKSVWHNKEICIQLSGYKPLVRSFSEEDIAKSIREVLTQVD